MPVTLSVIVADRVRASRAERTRHRPVLHDAAALGRDGGRERDAGGQRVGDDDAVAAVGPVVVDQQRIAVAARRSATGSADSVIVKRTDPPTAAQPAPSRTRRTRTCRWSALVAVAVTIVPAAAVEQR